MKDARDTKRVNARVNLDAEAYRAVRHIAADLGPAVDTGQVIAVAVAEYIARRKDQPAPTP